MMGAVGAGQVVQATSSGGIILMNGTLLALAAMAALRFPRNALDRPVVQRRANVRALLAVPGFLPLMALAALVLSSHALRDGFEVLRWEVGGIGPGAAGLLRSEGVMAEVVVFVVAGPMLLRWLGPASAAALAASAGVVGWSLTAVTAWLPALVLVEPLHGLTFALLHLACMQMLSVVVPPALAATAQAIYGGIAVGTMTAIITLVSGPLYGTLGPRAFWVMAAALRRCAADRVCDAQDLDQCIGVESDPVGKSVAACQPGPGRGNSAAMHAAGRLFRPLISRPWRPCALGDSRGASAFAQLCVMTTLVLKNGDAATA